MGKSHNWNETVENFFIHSIPQAINSVLVISLRQQEVCVMPKFTAGLLYGFCFLSFKTLLTPRM